MKKRLLLVMALLISFALRAQFKIEKIAYFSWNAGTQSYSTDTFQKFVFKFDNGEYAGYDRYYSNNTKQQAYKSKVFQNGVNDASAFGFGTQLYPLEYVESDKVGANWENKRKYEYVRDSEGALREFYMYNYVNGNWELLVGHKYETYKTGNNVDSVIRFIKTTGTQFAWKKSNKNIYEYTGSEVSGIIGMIYWQDNVPDTNFVYSDIDWKDVDNRITPSHNNQRIAYLNGTLNSYKLRYNEKDYETDPDNWVYYNFKMTYNADDQIIEFESLDDYKNIYAYRSDGRQVSAIYSEFDGSTWQTQSGTKTIDLDDNDGNYQIRHQQTYNKGTANFVNNYLILFNDATLTSVDRQEIQVSHVYPNPANNLIHVEMDNLESVNIMDLTGRMLNVEMTGSGQSRILNVASLPAGIYVLTVYAGNSVFTSRVVKN